MTSSWPRNFKADQFAEGLDGITCQAGVPVRGLFKVPAQQVVMFGKGAIVNGVDDRGILYLHFKDNAGTPVTLEGDYKLGYMDANKLHFTPLKEGDTEDMHVSKTVRDEANVLGLTGPGARQDSYLVIEFTPNAAAAGKVIEISNCDFKVPVVIYTP